MEREKISKKLKEKKGKNRSGKKRAMSVQKELEQVMKQRGGSVLGKKTILKSDHFPGCQNKRLSPHIDGAPNYRQVFPPLFTFRFHFFSSSLLSSSSSFFSFPFSGLISVFPKYA